MAKDYFSHDYNARNDKKLTNLFMKHGLIGIGAYWCIIEMLYEEGGYLMLDEYERITFELRTDYDLVKSVIEGFYLFEIDSEKFWSETALNRLNQRAEKSQKARESIEKRWKKYERNTNVKGMKNDSNTIKEKESKEKESKDINIIVDRIYLRYPSKCVVKNSSTGKSSKTNKDKIKKLLDEFSEEDIINKIDWYIKECKNSKTYMKNFSTFLNNLPDTDKSHNLNQNNGLTSFTIKSRFGYTKTFEAKSEDIAKQMYVNNFGCSLEDITECKR